VVPTARGSIPRGVIMVQTRTFDFGSTDDDETTRQRADPTGAHLTVTVETEGDRQ